jgi:hypothetical protein
MPRMTKRLATRSTFRALVPVRKTGEAIVMTTHRRARTNNREPV